jgi:uncharacterized membrane protein
MFDLKVWLIAIVSLLVLDGIWLGFIQKNYMQSIIERINPTETLKNNLTHPMWTFAVVYLLMSLALTYFVFNDPNKSKKTIYLETLLLAITIYATFDFTMLNLSGGWLMYDAIKDILWGITAFMVTSQIIIMYKGT